MQKKRFDFAWIWQDFVILHCFYPFVVLYQKRADALEHNIIEGVTDALFLAVRNFHKTNAIQSKCGVTATECSIYSPLVCRGYVYLHAHFTVCYILPAWVFLCLFIAKVVEDLEREQAAAKHPRFSML